MSRPARSAGAVAGGAKMTAWEMQLARLAAYKAARGDCNVPQGWAKDPGRALGSWVNDQRNYKKKLDRGEPSCGMTAERAAKLEALGFVWEVSIGRGSDEAAWEAQLARLAAHNAVHGDCKVPQGWAEDPGLGRWVNRQRVYKKKLDRGEPSHGMTVARAAKLEALGFAWKWSTAVQNNPHRTQAVDSADAAAQAFEVKAVVGKRRCDKGCLGNYNKTTMV
jgi:hypothetical protein